MCLDSYENNYSTFKERLKSFKSWKNDNVSPEDLAKNGFYFYRDLDLVKCNFCHIIIGNWQPGDKVSSEHYKYNPNCKIFTEKSSNFENKCKVCLKNDIEIVLFPCKHFNLCLSCAKFTYCPYDGIKINKIYSAILLPDLMYIKYIL